MDGGVLSGVSGRGGGGGTVAARGVEGEGAGVALDAHGGELVRNGLEVRCVFTVEKAGYFNQNRYKRRLRCRGGLEERWTLGIPR